jgi:hypothetical protein
MGTLGCGMMQDDAECSSPEMGALNLSSVPCCENVFHVSEFTSDFVPQFISPDTPLHLFAAAFVVSFLLPDSFEEAKPNAGFHPPPLLQADRQVLFQTFLI